MDCIASRSLETAYKR